MIALGMFAIVFWLLPAWAAIRLARGKNRNHRLWAIGSLFISWLAVLWLALLSRREKPVEF